MMEGMVPSKKSPEVALAESLRLVKITLSEAIQLLLDSTDLFCMLRHARTLNQVEFQFKVRQDIRPPRYHRSLYLDWIL